MRPRLIPGEAMTVSHHIIWAHANERVATLRSEAAPRPERFTARARRSSRSRWRRAYRAHILGLPGVAK
jgi:hypothetical protein